ncbi:MAG: hypothetical protein WBC98_10285 [Candidatus Zixiibacteriota bacterium]
MNMEYSKQDEIADVSKKRPHVVLLGAGASKAALPKGDNNGRKLPVMKDLVEIVGLGKFISEFVPDYEGRDFEEIYNQLVEKQVPPKVLTNLEDKIREYCLLLELPPTPTIYDHLLLGLRKKDLIATFNWDPLLVQAYVRNRAKIELPTAIFLHGNVRVGVCLKDKVVGMNSFRCSKCGKRLTPTKLLYPIKQKDYDKDPFIANEWRVLDGYLDRAFMLTIFGYSAPKSDISAIEMMKKAWGTPEKRELEQIEIIDIKAEDDLHRTWQDFICTHHYETKESFYESWIAKHPRRTVEACWNQFLEAKFIEENPIPRNCGFIDLWDWLAPLRDAERN